MYGVSVSPSVCLSVILLCRLLCCTDSAPDPDVGLHGPRRCDPMPFPTERNKSLIRPPGTAVPGGLLFYRRCIFFFATHSPRSLDRSP